MIRLSGISHVSRERLTKLIHSSKGFLTPSDVAKELNITSKKAALMLAYYTSNGWLSRVKRGLYIPLSMETIDTNVVLENPWLVATKYFDPCYIGGWTAIAYWGFTEQIYYDVMIYTAKKIRARTQNIQGVKFCLKSIYKKNIFGMKNIWVNGNKILISDPTRTIIDILDDLNIIGGVRAATDCLDEYLKSEHKNSKLLLEYCKQLGNKAIYKRLGFLLEHLNYHDEKLIQECMNNMSKGKNKLDPNLSADKLITKWRLWVPVNWISSKEQNDTKE